MNDDDNKPSVLILGGTGFIGRNLVEYLIENNLVSRIRVVDKVPPQTAWLNSKHQDVFADSKVEFKSANLINSNSCENAFNCLDGNDFQYVINLASETRLGQSEQVYKEGILKLSINCASEAEKRNVKRYIQISSGHMFSNGKNPSSESKKPSPSTLIARYKLQFEDELKKMTKLNYVIIRPAIVYGIGDRHEMTPRLVIGGIYKYMGEMLKLFWDKSMKLNTVHVRDVCGAIWHLLQNGKSREIYHLVDKGDTTLGKICDFISEIFNINHDYFGDLLSTLAKNSDFSSLVEEINEKHLSPWAEVCGKDGIVNTPLTPYIEQEMLLHKHVYLDGSKLESTGFRLTVLELRKDALLQILQDFINMGLFPPSLLLQY